MIEGISDFEISQTNGQPALILRSKGRIHTGGMIHVENKMIGNIYFNETQTS
jgi:hypothetical protein